ncbi:MAG: pre-peptidase C-terminal domain-containing protein [Haliscomenobacter sp.]|uniref:pre-peptidase C-terminal domain-containing protein n=1 Tax=Haliscomenobacter sp. TaxID=2717303 RepID=UPI0029AEEF7E|nr:pre-peptidase C-terminal domain-containing protein [Haliscomenobacter sp.]MDX2067169.1 pre-peptidase C-terminal domain-containing protein [Haliscomenobacter sp.]
MKSILLFLLISLFPFWAWGQVVSKVSFDTEKPMVAQDFKITLSGFFPNGCFTGAIITNYKTSNGQFLDLEVTYSRTNNEVCTQALIPFSVSKVLKINDSGSFEVRINGQVLDNPIYLEVFEETLILPTICSKSTTISCGQTLSGSTSSESSVQSSYSCSQEYSWNGPEKVYRFSVTSTSTVTITLALAAGLDLDLFLLSSCENLNCIAQSITNNSTSNLERISKTLSPGIVYYIVVDGEFSTSKGAFTINLNCGTSGGGESGGSICGKATAISCGSLVSGSTTNETNYLTTYNCLRGYTLLGPEKVYKLSISQRSPVTITLTIGISGLDLDLFLLNDVCKSGTGTQVYSISSGDCIAESSTPNTSSRLESITRTLDPGTYYIVIDGQYANSYGSFQLAVNCGSSGGNICEKAKPISCGSSISESTSSETNFLSSYSCLPGYTLVGPEKVYKFVLTETTPVSIRLDISTAGLDLDLFLLSNVCGYTTFDRALAISSNDCLAASYTSNANSRSEIINKTLSAGTYYIVVDGQYTSSKGNFQLSVNCNQGSICSKATPISCGTTVTSSNTAETNSLNQYDCLAGYNLVGPDRVYKFTLTERTTVDINLVIQTAGIDLDLFLLNNICASSETYVYKVSGAQCIAGSTTDNRSSNREQITQTLEAGTYYIVIDGQYTYSKGNFQLSVNCNQGSICSKAIPISCGTTVTSSNTTETNSLNQYDCLAGYNLVGPDRVYKFTLTERTAVDINLVIQTAGLDLDLFLLNNVCPSSSTAVFIVSGTQCIAGSTTDNRSSNREQIAQILEAGTYYIVIDGQYAYSKGNFQLSVNCNQGSICSKAIPISCGTTISASTTTETNSLNQYDCLAGYNLVGPDKVYKFTLTERTTVDINLAIQTAGLDLDLFLLNNVCPSTSTSVYIVSGAQCIANSSSNNLNSNQEKIIQTLDPGTYYIVVDGQFVQSKGSFVLSLKRGLCKTPVDVTCGTVLYNENFVSVSNCIDQYTCAGSASSYPGREKLYKIVLSSTTNLQVGLHSSAVANLDLFLFKSDDCNPITCIRKASASELSNSKYILESLPAGTYYLAVDGTGNNQNLLYSIDFTCGELACGNSPILSCNSAQSNNTVSGSNNVSVYGIKQANGTTKYYPGFIGKEKTYLLEVYETQNISIFLRPKINGEITGDPTLFLFKSCSKTDGLSISMTPGQSIERMDVLLTPGTYYVVVDEYLNVSSNFEVSISQTQACANICEYGSVPVYRGVTVNNNLRANELAPLLLYSESCVREIFGPNLSNKKLYADIYTFFNDEAGREISISLNTSSDQTTRAFVFRCNSLSASCLGVTSEGNLDLGNSPIGYYYIVIISTTNPTYSFNVYPNGVCQTNPEDIIPNTPAISRTVSGKVDNFNIGGGQYNGYSSCYNGSRTYRGEDLEFQFTVESAVTATITLTSNSAMGMFLYGYTCGKGCINYSETGATGGSTQIVDFPLSAGTYFIIVDKNTPGGIGNFTIKIETLKDEEHVVFIKDETCVQDESKTHTIRIQKPGLNYFENDSEVFFLYPTPDRKWLQSSSGSWDSDPARNSMSFELRRDLLTDADKCSYQEGDSIYICIRSGKSIEFLKPVYDRVGQNSSVNAGSKFKTGGISSISRFELEKPSHFFPSIRAIRVSSQRDTIVEFDFSTSDPFYVKLEPAANWISMLESGNTGAAPRDEKNPYPAQRSRIKLKINKNTSGVARPDVKLVFVSTGPIPFTNEVLVQQRICTPFSASLTTSSTTACLGQVVNLSTSVSTGTLSDYNFAWSNSNRTDPSIQVEASRPGPISYSVTVTGNENQCRAEKIATVTVNYIAAPAAPTAVQSTVSACTNAIVPTLSVSASSGLSVDWYNGAATNAVLLQSNSRSYTPTAFSQAGDYFFYAETRNSAGCTSPRIPIKVSVAPSLSAEGRIELNQNSNEVCAGSFVELKAVLNSGSTGNYNFEWSNGSSNSSISFGNVTPGDYALSVKISAKSGVCSTPKTLSTTFKALAKPTLPVLPSSLSVCSGAQADAITVNTPSTVSIYWYSNTGQLLNKSQSFQPPLITTPGEYSFFAEAVYERIPGCTSEKTQEIKLIVQENSIVSGTINTSTNSREACLGTPLQLSAVPNSGTAAEYSFKWSTGGFGPNVIANTNILGKQTFTVSITNNNLKCQTTIPAQISIEVKGLPEDPVPFEAEKNICQGTLTSLVVKPSAGSEMYWYTSLSSTENPFLSNSNNFTFVTPPPAGEKVYYVEARYSNGCVSKNRVPLKLVVNPNRSIEGGIVTDTGNPMLCQGEALQVSFKPTSGSLSDFRLEWSDNAFTGASRTILTTDAGEFVYKLKVSGAQGTCVTPKEFTYQVNVLSMPRLTANVPENNYVCLAQQNAQLSLTTTSNTIVDWFDQNQVLLKQNANPFSPNVSSGEYTYYAQLRSTEGCINQQKIAYKLKVYPKLDLNREPVEYPILCYGGNDGIIHLRVNESNIGELKYNWSDRPGLNVPRRTNLSAETYSVELLYGIGCTQKFNILLSEPDSIQIKVVQIVGDTSQFRTGRINVEVQGGNPPYSFIWKRNGRAISNEQNLKTVPADIYQLEVFDANNCSKLSQPISVPSVVGTTTGTKEHPWQSLIKVSPNPSDGMFLLTLDLPEQVIMNIEVLNQLGQSILRLPERSIFKNKVEINLHKQEAGGYFIRLAFAQGVITKRILLVR